MPDLNYHSCHLRRKCLRRTNLRRHRPRRDRRRRRRHREPQHLCLVVDVVFCLALLLDVERLNSCLKRSMC